MKKIIRITTVAYSLGGLLRGQSKFMSQFYEVIGISSSDSGHLELVGKEEGIEVIAIEMTRNITPIKDLFALWKLYKVFRKEKPYMVHSHTPKAGTLGMMAAYLARVPHRWHTIAGLPLLETRGFKRWMLDLVEKVTYRCATKVLPNSYGLYDIVLKNKYTTPKKLKVIGKGSSNGIDTAHFDPVRYTPEKNEELRKSLGISDDDFVYIYVGRFVPDKGINELVSAFESLLQKHDFIKLLMIGGLDTGDLDPLKKSTIRSLENNPAIIGTGFVEDVRPFLAISDILVFPSYREGFPNVVLEAGAMGLPAIVSDINGCNEIIENGRNGMIVPVKNEAALSTSMGELLENPSKLTAMALNARILIKERYERSYVWSELLKEYKTLESKK